MLKQYEFEIYFKDKNIEYILHGNINYIKYLIDNNENNLHCTNGPAIRLCNKSGVNRKNKKIKKLFQLQSVYWLDGYSYNRGDYQKKMLQYKIQLI